MDHRSSGCLSTEHRFSVRDPKLPMPNLSRLRLLVAKLGRGIRGREPSRCVWLLALSYGVLSVVLRRLGRAAGGRARDMAWASCHGRRRRAPLPELMPLWAGSPAMAGPNQRTWWAAEADLAGRLAMLAAAAQWPAGLGQRDASGQAPRNGDHSDQDSKRHDGLSVAGQMAVAGVRAHGRRRE
ncbi:hypothetical protein K458DRAFT_485977 [Lentithecium fluviatile CBS 122367]|uniref:Uncharacterized protein n=1 Tax=Lentithecium fluviatile CBS 122367 TaxID=1168545 RepID=A0A6G1J8H9_9PLEO|nr:hypothetical protein K458DRAFT_485977 [Lentithecium fluviatile CBS 122367]